MPAPTPFTPIDLDKPGIKALKKPRVKPGELTSNDKMAVRALLKQTKQGQLLNPSMDVAPAPRRKYNKDELKLDVQSLSQRVIDYLKYDNRLEQRLEFAGLKDIAVIMGILTDKLLLLEGQPTQIISNQQHQKMDEAMAKIIEEAKRRGLTVTATERTIGVQVEPKP